VGAVQVPPPPVLQEVGHARNPPAGDCGAGEPAIRYIAGFVLGVVLTLAIKRSTQ
jgi:hypothetical protein